MRPLTILSFLVSIGAYGCAAQGRMGVTLMQPESTQQSAIDVGSARVLDDGINPMDGVRITPQKGDIAVRFSHPHGPAEVERLNPVSLDPESRAEPAVGTESAEPLEAVRVVVDGGRHVVALWKSGDAERGYRVMAQAFNTSDNSALGAAVPVSPAAADVAGPLSATTVDGHHVVAGFAISTGAKFSAYAVPVEVL